MHGILADLIHTDSFASTIGRARSSLHEQQLDVPGTPGRDCSLLPKNTCHEHSNIECEVRTSECVYNYVLIVLETESVHSDHGHLPDVRVVWCVPMYHLAKTLYVGYVGLFANIDLEHLHVLLIHEVRYRFPPFP